MHLAVINEKTKVVENTIVPPEGAQVWVAGLGYFAILTDKGQIGDTWDGKEFIKPPPEEPA